MIRNKNFVTPQLQGEMLEAAIKTGDHTSIPILGTVEHIVDSEKRIFTNVTTADHLLYPGTVEHMIEQEGTTIFLHTRGTGEGFLPWVNEFLSQRVWRGSHRELKKAIEEMGQIVKE
jgi:hypothetical protein